MGGAGSTVTVLIDADERLFGPYWSSDTWFLMFLPLVTFDAQGETVPRLARSWDRSADGRVWTFHLRPDVRWHDGVPVTAADVKFSIELAGHPDILFDDAWVDVDSIAVRDDTTLTIFYGRPRDARDDWIVYWPRHLLEGLDPEEFYDWDFWKEPVGNGPYRYVRHVPQTMVELEANPDFFGGRPAIERLVIKFGRGSGITELLSGNVDILTRANAADIPTLAADPRFRVYHFMGPAIPWLRAIRWNHERPGLGDARVRRALTHAIDRRELTALLNLPPDLHVADVPFTGRQYRRGELPAPLEYDPARARELLAEAGWGGGELRFTALVTGGGADEQAAIYVQAALREVGVDMRIRPVDNSVLRARLSEDDFDAAFVPYWNHVDGHLEHMGAAGYRNPEVTRLLASVKETADPAEIDSIYRALWPTLQSDLPITLLYPDVRMYVVHRRIQGLESPFASEPIMFMEHLWVEDADESLGSRVRQDRRPW